MAVNNQRVSIMNLAIHPARCEHGSRLRHQGDHNGRHRRGEAKSLPEPQAGGGVGKHVTLGSTLAIHPCVTLASVTIGLTLDFCYARLIGLTLL